jgi:hypothetical protein
MKRKITVYNPGPQIATIDDTIFSKFKVQLTNDLSGTNRHPEVVGLQNSLLPATASNQFVKRSSDNVSWEGVTYGAESNTIAQGNDVRFRQALYKPKELLIYYGYLNSFNSAQNAWYNEKVAQDMSKYSMLVFGDGVQDPGHPDYASTQVIIARLKVLNPDVLIFGYVTIPQIIGTFQTKVDQWNALQVNGILMDEAGYDYGTNRVDFNTRVDYVHARTYAKICFVNAWNPDHILGTVNDVSYPNSTWNSSLTASNLLKSDWVLLESFAINTTAYSGTGGYESASDWYSRGSKAISLRSTYGVNFAACGIIDNTNVNGQNLFDFGFVSALMWSLDGFGTSDTSYGSGAAVKHWIRHDLSDIGTIWNLNPVVKVDVDDADVYIRCLESAKLLLDFSSSAQGSDVDRSKSKLSILSVSNDIDAKVAAVTNLYIVPLRKKAVITSALIQVKAADTITVVPTLGIGIAAGEDDIFAATSLTGLNSVSKLYCFSGSGTYAIGNALNIIKCGIDTGATATTMTISITLIGYLI